MTSHARPLQLGIAIAAALAGLALAGCNKPDTPADKKVTAGTELDDSVITTKVKAAILEEPSLKSTEINVETFKGTVQLSGFVSSRAAVDKAVEVARQVKGVTSVKNDMIVKGQQ